MKKALYRYKSLPSIDMSRKRKERGGEPLTKKVEKSEKVKKWLTSLYKKPSFGHNRNKYGAIKK